MDPCFDLILSLNGSLPVSESHFSNSRFTLEWIDGGVAHHACSLRTSTHLAEHFILASTSAREMQAVIQSGRKLTIVGIKQYIRGISPKSRLRGLLHTAAVRFHASGGAGG
jgi:hypothetical protein